VQLTGDPCFQWDLLRSSSNPTGRIYRTNIACSEKTRCATRPGSAIRVWCDPRFVGRHPWCRLVLGRGCAQARVATNLGV
jgi:hypothetical protein